MAEEKTAEDQAAELDLDAPLVKQGGYIENPDHTPNPYFQNGTLETTDLGTTPHDQLQGVSPIFEVARAENLRVAARALDPNDTEVSADLVILPSAQVTVQGSERTAEDARAEVFGAVRRLTEEPVILGVSPAAQQAARGTAPEDVDDTISKEEQERLDAKKTAQEDEERRLADVRAASADTASASRTTDTTSAAGQPVAGTSSTPSANPPKTEATSTSTSGARKTTGTAKNGNTK